MINTIEFLKQIKTMICEGKITEESAITIEDIDGYNFDIQRIEVRETDIILIPKYTE